MSKAEFLLRIFTDSDIGVVLFCVVGFFVSYALYWLVCHIWGWIDSGYPWWYYGSEVDRNRKIQKKIDKIHDEEWEL